jgi:hypothetical protein
MFHVVSDSFFFAVEDATGLSFVIYHKCLPCFSDIMIYEWLLRHSFEGKNASKKGSTLGL